MNRVPRNGIEKWRCAGEWLGRDARTPLPGRGRGGGLSRHDATADGNRAKRREVKSGPLSCGRGSRKVTHSPSPTWKQQRRQVS